MNIEYEIKILDINIDDTIRKLQQAGYVLGTVQNFQRYVFELPQQPNSWIRLRTDGTKTTIALKEYKNDAIDGVNETEVIVSDFERMHAILVASGVVEKNYQENRRHNFIHADSERPEVSIDTWPGIPAYLEIEGNNESAVSRLVDELNLDNKKTSAPTSEVYKLYGIDILQKKKLMFSEEKN